MNHTSIPGESTDDPNQTNVDSVGRTCFEVRKASTVSSRLGISLQPCGKHEIGERLNCLASETRSIGPKKQKLLGLRCVWEEICATDCVSGKATGFLEFKKAFLLYSSFFYYAPDEERFRDALVDPEHAIPILICTVMSGKRLLIIRGGLFSFRAANIDYFGR